MSSSNFALAMARSVVSQKKRRLVLLVRAASMLGRCAGLLGIDRFISSRHGVTPCSDLQLVRLGKVPLCSRSAPEPAVLQGVSSLTGRDLSRAPRSLRKMETQMKFKSLILGGAAIVGLAAATLPAVAYTHHPSTPAEQKQTDDLNAQALQT